MKNILLVEDKDWVRQDLGKALFQHGYQVSVAEDGQAALQCLSEKPDGYFDVIISDVLMPNVDGVEFVTGLRAVNNQTPVLLISGGGYGMVADEVLLNAETLADGILKKPFTHTDLHRAIDKLLSS